MMNKYIAIEMSPTKVYLSETDRLFHRLFEMQGDLEALEFARKTITPATDSDSVISRFESL